jgi:hypothetical protein
MINCWLPRKRCKQTVPWQQYFGNNVLFPDTKSWITSERITTQNNNNKSDRLCCLVVRVPGYRARGLGSIPGASGEIVGLERGPLSLVSTIEELLERKSSVSSLESRAVGICYADYVAPSIHKSWHRLRRQADSRTQVTKFFKYNKSALLETAYPYHT